MAATRKKGAPRPSKTAVFGLLANGSCGPWEIAIDEYSSAADRWYAQIDGPNATFYFAIPSLEIVAKMVEFLRPEPNSPERKASLVLCKSRSAPITLVRDDEYDDRFFLVVGPKATALVRFVIGSADVSNIVEALRQVQNDIDDKD